MKYILYCLVSLVLLQACGNNEEKTAANAGSAKDVTPVDSTIVTLAAQQVSAVGVEVGHPQEENLNGVIVLQGTVDVAPQSLARISSPLGGYVKSTGMLPGLTVRKGQVLAVLEDMQFVQLQQDYLTAKTNLELATSDYDRQKELNASKASSDKIFQQARAEMERQRILISALGEKLKLIGITGSTLTSANVSKEIPVVAPISGFISKVNVAIGKYAAPTDVLFEIVNAEDLHLSLNVFEKDLPSIAIGEKVQAYTNSDPGKKSAATVFLINKAVDENRMAEVHCHFQHQPAALYPGMFMNAEVAVEGAKGLTVPDEAVVRWENKYYVFTEEASGRYKMNEIAPGIHANGKQQVSSGSLNTGSKVVVKNAFALLMKIKNKEEEG